MTTVGTSNPIGREGAFMPHMDEREEEIRNDICGEVTRQLLSTTGAKCGQQTAEDVAEQLDNIQGVNVDRWKPAEDQFDDRDFIDLTITRSSSAGRMFLILTRNGFVPEAMAGNWEGDTPDGEDGRVVLQWKR